MVYQQGRLGISQVSSHDSAGIGKVFLNLLMLSVGLHPPSYFRAGAYFCKYALSGLKGSSRFSSNPNGMGVPRHGVSSGGPAHFASGSSLT